MKPTLTTPRSPRISSRWWSITSNAALAPTRGPRN